ncbi:xyloglucanase [Pelomonas sp. Root1237]|nr:xyloglucanase [Pelomonas sp. Root1237]
MASTQMKLIRTKTFWRPLLATALALLASLSQAEPYRWDSLAIGGGGYVAAIVPSQTERGLIYARTDVGGAYRWDAAKARWTSLLDGVSEADVGLLSVDALALDPKDSAVVYLLAGVPYFSGGKTAVMRSIDRGATFSRVTDVSHLFRANGNGLGRSNGEKMQVDPGDGKVLYVGSRANGLFKSLDAGASFKRVDALPVTTTPNETGISFVLLDPTSVVNGTAQRIFVGVSRFGSVGPNLYRSDDAGASFKPVAEAPSAYIPQRATLAADGHLYITYGDGSGPHGDWKKLDLPEPLTAGQVWKYKVASGAWTDVTPKGINRAFSGVSVDPRNAKRLVISTINTWMPQGGKNAGDRFYVTNDGGSNWTDVVERGFAMDTNGVSWISAYAIHWTGSIEFDPFDTHAVWVTSGNGVFRTADIDAKPATWTFTVKGLEETVPNVAVSVPGGPLLSVIADYDGFRHQKLDAFAPIHEPRLGSTTGLAVAGSNTAVVVRVGGKKMYRSADTGTTWTEVGGMQGGYGTLALSADGAALLHSFRQADGSNRTVRSTNFTEAKPVWTAVRGLEGAPMRPVGDPVNPAKFYAYDRGTMRVSTDGGASFAATATLAANGSSLVRVAPGREGDVWVALKAGGLARSTDAGRTFTTLPNVAHCGAVGFGKAMANAPYPTVFIWGSPQGKPLGVYRSTDAGANWQRINDDAHQFGGPGNGEFVMGDMNVEGLVYMSTVGRGIVYGLPADAPNSLKP